MNKINKSTDYKQKARFVNAANKKYDKMGNFKSLKNGPKLKLFSNNLFKDMLGLRGLHEQASKLVPHAKTPYLNAGFKKKAELSTEGKNYTGKSAFKGNLDARTYRFPKVKSAGQPTQGKLAPPKTTIPN